MLQPGRASPNASPPPPAPRREPGCRQRHLLPGATLEMSLAGAPCRAPGASAEACPALDGFRLVVLGQGLEKAEAMAAPLRDAGCTVRLAGQVMEAVDIAFGGWYFDALVTDMAAPQLQAVWLIARLRAQRPWLPVLMLAGEAATISGEPEWLREGPSFVFAEATPEQAVLATLLRLSCRAFRAAALLAQPENALPA